MNAEFEGMLKQLGGALFDRVEQQLPAGWNSLTLDARYDGNGGFLSKIRAIATDGEVISILPHNAIDLLLISLDGFRDAAGDEWYCMEFTVSPAMQCTVDFNYEPTCEQDESFFEN